MDAAASGILPIVDHVLRLVECGAISFARDGLEIAESASGRRRPTLPGAEGAP